MRLTINELWKICYEGQNVYRPWYNKYVSNVSIYFTWLLIHTPITANQVTIAELILVILSSIFFFLGKLEHIFVGLLIIQVTNMLDCVDGEIARYRKMPSLTGAYLENIYHQLVSYLMFFPLAFGVYIHTGWESILVFGFLCSIFSKSIAIPNIYATVIEKRLSGKSLPSSMGQNKKSADNLQGTKTGKRLSDLYDKFKDFWAWPTNILHLTAIVIVELVNKYSPFMPSYYLFYWYFVAYTTAVVSIQLTSFAVHYKGKAAEQYYKALFYKK